MKQDKRRKWVTGKIVLTEPSTSPLFNLKVCKITKVTHKGDSTINLDLKPLDETIKERFYLDTSQVRLLQPNELEKLGVKQK